MLRLCMTFLTNPDLDSDFRTLQNVWALLSGKKPNHINQPFYICNPFQNPGRKLRPIVLVAIV